MDELAHLGVVGLGPMGRNLALNAVDKGFSVAAWDAWAEPVERFAALAERELGDRRHRAVALREAGAFVAALARPRRVLLMVKAGEVVDRTIATLRPLLQPGDLIIDGGNEWYEHTERRGQDLASASLRFVGMGVSGGEQGARHGPSLMPGGPRDAYHDLAPVLTRIAAQVEDGPCVTHCGPGGAGHYVKMVHNGIEYGDMQLIAEAYDLLRGAGGLSAPELADVFAAWNEGELNSFLIEITARILRRRDPEAPGAPDRFLVDAILDEASMKGTGTWTVRDALALGVPAPTMAAAVDARVASSDRAARLRAARLLSGPAPAAVAAAERPGLIADVRAALYAAKACSYAQGFALLRAASRARSWDVPLAELARIWKGGCIIRAKFLGRIQQAFARAPEPDHLLLDPGFSADLAERQDAWRRVVARAAAAGIPAPATGSSLAYYDTLRRERLPANLIQAQRDYFGAHTYRRLDRAGTFHTDWEPDGGGPA